MVTVCVLAMAVVFRIISAELVPTEPSITTVVPLLLKILKKLAVPEATALAEVTADSVIVPFESVPKAPLTGKLTSKV